MRVRLVRQPGCNKVVSNLAAGQRAVVDRYFLDLTVEVGEIIPSATDENEKEQLEGFMMMYELVRPICRASLTEESLIERRKSRMNLKTQTMTATLKESEKTSRDALALILKQSDNSP